MVSGTVAADRFVVAAMGVIVYAVCVLIERRYIHWPVRGLEPVS